MVSHSCGSAHPSRTVLSSPLHDTDMALRLLSLIPPTSFQGVPEDGLMRSARTMDHIGPLAGVDRCESSSDFDHHTFESFPDDIAV